LTSPLGQTIARLEGDAAGVKIQKPDGRVDVAEDWDTLTSRSLGLTLPVRGLSAWLRGLPREGSQYTVERDERNRPSVLRQDGWEVTYAYAEPDATHAARVTLRYPGADPIEVRIAVDRWE
jgi:outer membrane lipoprotein LolB